MCDRCANSILANSYLYTHIQMGLNVVMIAFHYCISQLECYIRIIRNVSVLLDYEIPADSMVYLCIYIDLYSNCDRLWR